MSSPPSVPSAASDEGVLTAQDWEAIASKTSPVARPDVGGGY